MSIECRLRMVKLTRYNRSEDVDAASPVALQDGMTTLGVLQAHEENTQSHRVRRSVTKDHIFASLAGSRIEKDPEAFLFCDV